MNATFSIIIPCYQSQDMIETTLLHLIKQNTRYEYEIIVVDSSTDETAEIVKKNFSQVNLITLPQRTLAAKARNIGAQQANGEYLVFIDSDCIAGSDWLDIAARTLNDAYCGLGGPVQNANPEGIIPWAGYILEFSDFMLNKPAGSVIHAPSGNLFIKKTVFDSVGGFPENFTFAQEDRYFSWLICKKTGKQFYYHPKISVKHHHRIGFAEFIRHQQNIGYGGAEILKITDLTGSGLIKNKPLMCLILPLLPFKKLTICLFRLLRCKADLVIRYPGLIVMLWLGMTAWGYGFARSVFARKH